MKTPRITRKACIGCGCDLTDRRCGGGLSFCLKCNKERRARVHSALHKVRRAVKRGDLPHPNTLVCSDCSAPAEVYDHRDYLKPLSVEPVCRSCNIRRGPAKINKPVTSRGTNFGIERSEMTPCYFLAESPRLGCVQADIPEELVKEYELILRDFDNMQGKLAQYYWRK